MKQTLYLLLIFFAMSCNTATNTAPAPSADLQGFMSEDIPGSAVTKVFKTGADGLVTESGFIRDGKKTGMWVTYSPEGKMKTISNYVDGKKNGPYIEMSTREQVELLATYKNDEYHGKYAKYKFGRFEEEMNYKDGKLDGEMKTYFTNGKLQKLITFKDGKQHGDLKYYDEEGNVTLEYQYKNGEKVSGGIVE